LGRGGSRLSQALPAGGEPTGRRLHTVFSGLGPAGPHGSRPGHQTLDDEHPSQVWLQKGAPV